MFLFLTFVEPQNLHILLLRSKSSKVQNSCFKFHPTDLKEIEKEISNLNRNKSDTFNSIPIAILKENIDITGKIIHNIFCNMITTVASFLTI